MINIKIITGKDGSKELVYIWSDKNITDIVYNIGGFRLKSDRRMIDEQINTYGEKAGKELADYLAIHQKQFEDRVKKERK